MQPGKHAALSVPLNLPLPQSRGDTHRAKDRPGKVKVKVCRPDVDLLAQYAAPLYAEKEAYFCNVLSCVKDGALSSTDAIHEIIMAVKQCVSKAQ